MKHDHEPLNITFLDNSVTVQLLYNDKYAKYYVFFNSEDKRNNIHLAFYDMKDGCKVRLQKSGYSLDLPSNSNHM